MKMALGILLLTATPRFILKRSITRGGRLPQPQCRWKTLMQAEETYDRGRRKKRRNRVVNEKESMAPKERQKEVASPKVECFGTVTELEDTISKLERSGSCQKILKVWDRAIEERLLSSYAAMLMIRAECRMRKLDLAKELIDRRELMLEGGHFQRNDTESTILVKSLCRAGDIPDAIRIGNTIQSESSLVEAYTSISLALAKQNRTGEAIDYMLKLWEKATAPSVDYFNRMIDEFRKLDKTSAVFKTLDSMSALGVTGDDRTYEKLASAVVKSVDFITGAVSMATLPTQNLPEAAFMGRSNVGKSSLLNMITNRKSVAFTSKTPGKTQQLNYFLVNKSSSRAFYLVDFPGAGFARVSKTLRDDWKMLMDEYLETRERLKVVFHLIDSRHGPVGPDEDLMKIIHEKKAIRHESPDINDFKYVIVLTKVDKRSRKVPTLILSRVKNTLQEAGFHDLRDVPVIFTSSVSCFGRDTIWKYLREVADPSLND